MRYVRRFPLCAALLAMALLRGSVSASAQQETKPFLHPIFTSHMVLQRDAQDPVWGWVTPGTPVTVTVTDASGKAVQAKTATAVPDGRWQANLGPFHAVPGNPAYRVTVAAPGVSPVTLTDVLIGDVWLCSGQSNMARSLITHNGIPDVLNQNAEIADTVHFPQIRQYYVANLAAAAPQLTPTAIVSDETGSSGPWLVNSPATAIAPSRYSAVAYFFARELTQALNIPIGIIQMSWGGTSIQAWIDPATLAEDSDFAPAVAKLPNITPDSGYPAAIYNGKVATITAFKIKGVVWYQGENNDRSPQQYYALLPLLFQSWRQNFGQPTLPFIVIQLPNFANDNWPILRDAQLNAVRNDLHSRLAVTIDVGDPKQLHPPDKQDPAHRAALGALNLAYGRNIVDCGPLFLKAIPQGNTIRCWFSHVGAGLMVGRREVPPVQPLVPTVEVKNGVLTGFEIAGKDGQFVPAQASITGRETLDVSSLSVADPVTVRYAWAGAPICNLYNKIVNKVGKVVDGLPASPFRFSSQEPKIHDQ